MVTQVFFLQSWTKFSHPFFGVPSHPDTNWAPWRDHVYRVVWPFPECYKYFLATQLATVAWWQSPDLSNPSKMLEAAVVRSLEALKFLVYRGPWAPYDPTPSMLTILWAWRVRLAGEGYQKYSCDFPQRTDLAESQPVAHLQDIWPLWLNQVWY